MRLAGNEVVVDGRTQGSFYLRGDTAEYDESTAACDGVDGEALGCEPGGCGVNVGLSEAEAVGELLRREPLVIVERIGVLLLGKKLIEFGLLLRGAREDEAHPVELQGGRYRALIGGVEDAGIRRACQTNGTGVADGAHNATLLGLLG